ncbi:MAG TPA: hypothetical protein VI072_18470 [Polyangiaceae bacterium]
MASKQTAWRALSRLTFHESLTATFDLDDGFAVVEALQQRDRRVQLVIPPHSVLALRVRR